MQRISRPPRNRQPRPPRQNHPSSRPSSLQSSFTGAASYHSSSAQFSRPSYPSSVPSISQVQPRTHVSIVLKADQPIGRQVQGVVADVLTRGNHPRGIKVRLVDGRVGRVQRMAGGEVEGTQARMEVGQRDLQEDMGGQEVPRAGYSLEDFLPKDHPLKEEKTERQVGRSLQGRSVELDSGSATKQASQEVQKCPMCGDFEGDGRAVEHHVNTVHFGD